MNLSDLIEIGETKTHRFYIGIEIEGNSERVCGGLAIDDGGNTPQDECLAIIAAKCRAIDDALGFVNATHVNSNFHKHTKEEPVFARETLARDEDGNVEDSYDLEFCERADLPADLLAMVDAAIEAGEKAENEAIAEVEKDHHDRTLASFRQAIRDEDEESARYFLECGLLTDAEKAEAEAFLKSVEN